jgi:hypothetical protein
LSFVHTCTGIEERVEKEASVMHGRAIWLAWDELNCGTKSKRESFGLPLRSGSASSLLCSAFCGGGVWDRDGKN